MLANGLVINGPHMKLNGLLLVVRIPSASVFSLSEKSSPIAGAYVTHILRRWVGVVHLSTAAVRADNVGRGKAFALM